MFVRDVLGRTLLESATALEATGSGETRWALLDGLGSSVATASGGIVTDLVSYSDFGVQGFETGGWASTAGLTGEASDPALGTVTFYSRTYEPAVGGWTSADSWRGTLTEPLTANRYAYVEDNPVTMVDAGGYLAVAPKWVPGIGVLVSRVASIAQAAGVVAANRAGLAAARAVPMVSAVSRVASAARAAARQAASRKASRQVFVARGRSATAASAAVVNRESERHRRAPATAASRPFPGCRTFEGFGSPRQSQIGAGSFDPGGPIVCPALPSPRPGSGNDPGVPWGSVIRGVLGIDDATGCVLDGSLSSCAWLAAGLIPAGGWGVRALKGVKVAENAIDLARPVVGLGDDAASAAFRGMRNEGGHAVRHLREGGIIRNSGSLASQVAEFEKTTSTILRSPASTFQWKLGNTASTAYAGVVDGKRVVIFVAQEGDWKGKVISAVIPDADQIRTWGLT